MENPWEPIITKIIVNASASADAATVEETDFTNGTTTLNAHVHVRNLFSALLSNPSTKKLVNANVPKLLANLDKFKVKRTVNAKSVNLNFVDSTLTMSGIKFFANVFLNLSQNLVILYP